MGSSGSGKFGTYHVGNGQTAGGSGSGAGGSGGGAGGVLGGGTGEIECPAIIENIRLEDVATSDYYVTNHSLPASGDPVDLHNAIHKGRLVVKATSTGEILGNLPTQYNYLINCIKRGMHYTGVVVASGKTPVPFVVVTLHA
jgi:hypothetical protein